MSKEHQNELQNESRHLGNFPNSDGLCQAFSNQRPGTQCVEGKIRRKGWYKGTKENKETIYISPVFSVNAGHSSVLEVFIISLTLQTKPACSFSLPQLTFLRAERAFIPIWPSNISNNCWIKQPAYAQKLLLLFSYGFIPILSGLPDLMSMSKI